MLPTMKISGDFMQKNYYELNPSEIEYIVVKTTSEGLSAEDVFFLIFGKDSFWEVP